MTPQSRPEDCLQIDGCKPLHPIARDRDYARVSSEQQGAAHTIESQLAALTERARSDGPPVPVDRQFADEGVSGATLVRPALDRLRDRIATGVIDEWRRAGVNDVCLNRSLRVDPLAWPELDSMRP